MPTPEEMEMMLSDGMALKDIATRMISYAKKGGAGASEEESEETPMESEEAPLPMMAPDEGKEKKKSAIIIALGKKLGK
jgi:hypothetical protein